MAGSSFADLDALIAECEVAERERKTKPLSVRRRSPRENNRTHYLIVQGERRRVNDWAHRMDLPKATIYSRLRRGWSAEAAVLTPVSAPVRIAFEGQEMTVRECAQAAGVNRTALYWRLPRWGVERALGTPVR
jgi:transcriptional regulator of acetoin/glycerol metabolism